MATGPAVLTVPRLPRLHRDVLPPSRELYGREVVDAGGRRLGCVALLIRRPDGERVAVIRRRHLTRPRLYVSLRDAEMSGSFGHRFRQAV